jgi:hypothetical protein
MMSQPHIELQDLGEARENSPQGSSYAEAYEVQPAPPADEAQHVEPAQSEGSAHSEQPLANPVIPAYPWIGKGAVIEQLSAQSLAIAGMTMAMLALTVLVGKEPWPVIGLAISGGLLSVAAHLLTLCWHSAVLRNRTSTQRWLWPLIAHVAPPLIAHVAPPLLGLSKVLLCAGVIAWMVIFAKENVTRGT